MDFFSQKELTTQVGSAVDDWPIVVLKELVDNALDACEDAGVVPVIRVVVNDEGITVIDNGPGIPAETVAGAIDFSVRVSSREAYIAPDRGAQGNALMTLVAMPFVLDGTKGSVEILARGVRHEITISMDAVRQVPVVDHQQAEMMTTGTKITLHWPDSAGSNLRDAETRFLQVAEGFTFLNPHLSLTLDWMGSTVLAVAGEPSWSKWTPSEPTSAHWYRPADFERLVAAYVAHDADRGTERSVREFVTEFRGLTGTAKTKAILTATGLTRVPLSDLVSEAGLDSARIGELLVAMQEHSKPPKPPALGVIGREHLKARLIDAGGDPESFDYQKKAGLQNGIPWIVETAFAWRPEHDDRRLITGVNWSPALSNPFRELGEVGRSLDSVLSAQYARRFEPVALVIHLAIARVQYTDRGKSAVVIER